MQMVIELSDEVYKDIKEENGIYGINNGLSARITGKVVGAIQSGTPVNANTLADMVINERIYGDFKQDICYEEPVIEHVKCRLELSIIDRRPCYCGAELREVWRDKNKIKN